MKSKITLISLSYGQTDTLWHIELMTELKKSWDCYTCYIIRSSSLRSLIRPIYCVAAERGNQGPGRQQRRDIQHQDKLWPILIMTIIWLTAGIMSRVRQLGQTIRGFNEKGVWANTDIQNYLSMWRNIWRRLIWLLPQILSSGLVTLFTARLVTDPHPLH